MKPLRLPVFLSLLLVVHSAFAADDAAPKTIAPPENLVIDGIPPIPAEVAEQVGRYTEARSASLAAWHPTLPEMLILTRFADTNQVHVVGNPAARARS